TRADNGRRSRSGERLEKFVGSRSELLYSTGTPPHVSLKVDEYWRMKSRIAIRRPFCNNRVDKTGRRQGKCIALALQEGQARGPSGQLKHTAPRKFFCPGRF